MAIIEKLQNAHKLRCNSDVFPGIDRWFTITSQFISQLIRKTRLKHGRLLVFEALTLQTFQNGSKILIFHNDRKHIFVLERINYNITL